MPNALRFADVCRLAAMTASTTQVEYDALRALATLCEGPTRDVVLLWSGQWAQWWGPNRGGYSPSLLDAGFYSRAEAEAIVRGCGPEKRIEIRELATEVALLANRGPLGQLIAALAAGYTPEEPNA